MQRKLGEADADGNWQFGSPASASAMDDKTQAVAAHKRRARTAPAAQFSASNLQAAVHHNAAKEKEEAKETKPVDQGEQSVPNAEEQAAAADVPSRTRIQQLRFRSMCRWQASSRSRRRTRTALTTTRSISPTRCVAQAASARSPSRPWA